MKPKPTKSAPPRLLPNGQPDQSNAVVLPKAESEALIGELARTLPGFARMMATGRR